MSTTQRAGRPRDPAVEDRARRAARAVYAERGWSGFTLDEVARRSGIGKGSLYLRWPDKAALLVEAVRERTRFIAEIDTGALRSDLIEFATGWLEYMTTDDGVLTYRLNVDSRFVPEVWEALADDPYPEHVRATRAMVRRGIARGELPQDASVALIADLVAGAVSNHVRATPQYLQGRVRARSAEYVAHLVDTVLAGVAARSV
ncbi:TetR/AcrR family transcriptional regulator [Saccharopolyspora sp. HNM0983]|uniref:TetR/AcrR family transcriptional regulator n=1 Tax=Saccharopolyspora montiporae TaxID=2781240 RepID=A0A929BAM4_9PSEU|nr:TetR/AcrR family transcriptional regulator [Saccharopolyspora sp. HNM0983]